MCHPDEERREEEGSAGRRTSLKFTKADACWHHITATNACPESYRPEAPEEMT